jgi:hypothetical protein
VRGERNGARQGRRWCVPSAILRSPGETLDGIGILRELDNELGLLLWSVVRDVTLWASTPAAARARLFGMCSTVRLSTGAASVPDSLRRPLENLSALLTAPGRADADVLALCCMQVTAWARESQLPRTALAVAQAGALAAPEFSEAAMQTAICALELREPERAETWLRRAVAVARRERDAAVYVTAYVHLGNLYRERGRPLQAERYLLLGYRMARRRSVPLARRDAAYALFRMALDREDRSAATRWAVYAQRGYRKDQPQSVPLLLGLARFWTDQGQAGRSRAALQRLTLHLGELARADALAAAALLARALAETEPRNSKAAENRAWRMLADESIADEAAFAAALDLAHGAAVRRDRKSFDRATRAALRFASTERYDWTRNTLAALGREAFAPAHTESADG